MEKLQKSSGVLVSIGIHLPSGEALFELSAFSSYTSTQQNAQQVGKTPDSAIFAIKWETLYDSRRLRQFHNFFVALEMHLQKTVPPSRLKPSAQPLLMLLGKCWCPDLQCHFFDHFLNATARHVESLEPIHALTTAGWRGTSAHVPPCCRSTSCVREPCWSLQIHSKETRQSV